MKVLFAAGGTGGHINPALAAAGMVRERHPEAQILFVGTAEKMEARLVPAAGYDFRVNNKIINKTSNHQNNGRKRKSIGNNERGWSASQRR